MERRERERISEDVIGVRMRVERELGMERTLGRWRNTKEIKREGQTLKRKRWRERRERELVRMRVEREQTERKLGRWRRRQR